MHCPSCFGRRSCCDHSSRSPRSPSLADLRVVESILEQACRNTASRWQEFQNGSRTGESLREADEKLVDWLAATFAGANPAFRTDEDWNPRGLAGHLRETLLTEMGGEDGRLPEDDEEVIAAAADLFVRGIHDQLEGRGTGLGFLTDADSQSFVSLWAGLFCGAPLAD